MNPIQYLCEIFANYIAEKSHECVEAYYPDRVITAGEMCNYEIYYINCLDMKFMRTESNGGRIVFEREYNILQIILWTAQSMPKHRNDTSKYYALNYLIKFFITDRAGEYPDTRFKSSSDVP